MSIARCATCNGPILSSSCQHCGRSPEPERVSLAEALLSNMTPENEPGLNGKIVRQRAPIAVSIARAEAWLRGEMAI
jgi:hypothetical protein